MTSRQEKDLTLVWSSIQAAPAYGVYISQLLRYSRACGFYRAFLDKRLLPTKKIVNQELVVITAAGQLFSERISSI
jgi:hypothetical protein